MHNFYLETPIPKGCFNVTHKTNGSTLICQKSFDKYAVGITTPENYTILFSSPFCSSIKMQRYGFNSLETVKEFIGNYSFDPDLRSCYKIYDAGVKPSPETCSKRRIAESCVFQYNSSCTAIATPQNETVLLNCRRNNGCFSMIDGRGNIHETCQKRFDDRCIGLLLPSNLSVLFECQHCLYDESFRLSDLSIVVFEPNTWKLHRQFVQEWFSKEKLQDKWTLRLTEFMIIAPRENFKLTYCMQYNKKAYAYWMPGRDCWAVTLPSNETVVLECLGTERRTNCFDVYGSGGKTNETCLRVFQEQCVGLITPMGYTLIVDCYRNRKCFDELIEEHKNLFKNSLDNKNFKLVPFVPSCYEVSYQEPNDYTCMSPTNFSNYACVDLIFDGTEYCWGLVTPKNETVKFLCHKDRSTAVSFYHADKATDCFEVKRQDGTSEEVCQKKTGDYSIGFTTSQNSSIILASYYCDLFFSEELDFMKEFVRNYTFDAALRSCYKVYGPEQVISPYTCLSRAIQDACLRTLREFGDCEGIITQNGETVLLNCSGREPVENGCFEVYSSDGRRHVACQKKLEERCVGITTPSNLSVLFECLFCKTERMLSQGKSFLVFDREERKNTRDFIKSTMSDVNNGNFTVDITSAEYHAFNPGDSPLDGLCGLDQKIYFTHVLYDHSNSTGFRTVGYETIVLKRPDDATYGKNGCFDVFTPIEECNVNPKRKKSVRCVEILDEFCIGIRTPRKWTVPLVCTNACN
ncbi:unnamed protein product [Phyllotreta striolata]|uniref:Uncharacterized protein n=1 Tax=Phyllotreta striolata TaxID=444603 RepID=A0A9P0DVN0_PHYSR|nr:unnamed protein product [Phyllotreta striolata]